MSAEFRYMGHEHGYWLELQRKAETLNAVHLLEEIATLRSKVSFYESRIKEMEVIMNKGEAK